MMYLFTGAIGTGKTTYVVDELMKVDAKNKKHIEKGELDKVRKIYSNISGLKIDHDAIPDDWRDTPKNSVIAWDECHKFSLFQHSRQKLITDPRVIDMNESRHEGYDLYFITQQQPSFLHQHIRGLCSQHFHFHNPMGLKMSTVFVWRHGNTTTPDSQTAKRLAEREFIYTFKEDVQNNFESIEQGAEHTRKVHIPRKLFLICGALFFMICLMVYLLSKKNTVGVITGENYTQAVNTQNKDNLQNGAQAVNDMQNFGKQKDLSFECRKAINVEKPQCVQWFDNLSKNGGSISDSDSQSVKYDASKPFESSDEIEKNISYTVTSKPLFSGCMYANGKYTAYTQQGTVLHSTSKQDCQRLIVDADRPFNYFAKEQNEQQNQQQNFEKNITEQIKQLSSEEIAKFQEAKRLGLI